MTGYRNTPPGVRLRRWINGGVDLDAVMENRTWLSREIKAIRDERDRYRATLGVIAQDTALSAETHRLIVQDVLAGFVERGER